jgi:mono/diheme cytochrome c family protein
MLQRFTWTYRRGVSIRGMTKRQLALRIVIVVGAVFLLIQLVPYGRTHANPAVTQAVRWDSPTTAKLASDACMDCHSNLTNWKWYSNVAPASWLVQRDVDEGRNHLNFSEWNKPQPDLGEVLDAIKGGGMPPIQYKLIHPASRLSSSERDALARGIAATYKKDPPPIGGGG